MKKQILALSLLLTAPLFGMEADDNSVVTTYQPAARQAYPDGMGFVSEEGLLAHCEPLPGDVKNRVEALLEKHPNILKLLSLPQQYAAALTKQPIPEIPSSLSPHNYVFDTNPDDPREVLKIAGFHNALRSAISSLGYDPYNKSNPADTVARAAASKTPRFQLLSTLATMELLERAESGTVVPVKTWAYNLTDHPNDACDQNYIVVQRRLPKEYKQFSTLDTREKHDVLEKLELAEVWRVLKYANLWNPSEENLWVNSSKQTELAYPDGEKPNNEGAGTNAKWKISIFGQDLSKAKFNIRNEWDGGHRVFENILKAHCPDRVAEWMAYYESDTEVK